MTSIHLVAGSTCATRARRLGPPVEETYVLYESISSSKEAVGTRCVFHTVRQDSCFFLHKIMFRMY